MDTTVGIDVSGRQIAPYQLQQELEAGGVPVPHGLVLAGPDRTEPVPYGTFPVCVDGTYLFTLDEQGNPAALPPEADPIVAAHMPAIVVGA